MIRICLAFVRFFIALLICLIPQLLFAQLPTFTHFEPTHDSLKNHKNPEWYEDAKFGVMIHYGLYSVPGWAPLFDPTGKIFSKEFFINNPYSEWYFNTMQIKDSPTYTYHRNTFGENFHYEDFVPIFNEEVKKWNPNQWADLFAASQAKYVVFVSKHRDGFLLWPSDQQNPFKKNYYTQRDVVGELTEAVHKRNLHMGIYYNGDDWTWQNPSVFPVTNLEDLLKNMAQSQEYADYVNHHWHELIDKYHPDLIWGDFALPKKVNKWKLFADYYNTVPWGILDNRWGQDKLNISLFGQPSDELLDFQMTYDWFDYYTPEYLAKYRLTRHRWEADHGPGYSFGYNRQEYEHPEHLKNVDQLIVDLADIVSKNGNLLLAISPAADGTIPLIEQNLLLDIGHWLEKNGEAIFETRPWSMAEGTTSDPDIEVRYTCSKDYQNLYILFLKNPSRHDLTIYNLGYLDPKTNITLLNGKESIPIKWISQGVNLTLFLSQISHPVEHPLSVRVYPIPKRLRN